MDYSRFDPQLRTWARVLPKGFALHRGLRLPRTLMKFAGVVGAHSDTEVVRIGEGTSVRIHRPATRPADSGPVLLWIHGGGTIMGSAAQEDGFCRKLVNFTDVTVVAVEHRLAPEHPFPGPRDDCYTALQWVAEQPWADRARLAVGGVSAGGGFAAAVAQLAHDRGEIALALQMLVHPMLDDRSGIGDRRRRVMWSGDDNQIAWKWYLAGVDPQAAVPARRVDLSGLAPAWIGVGTEDLFYDETVDYARRLRDAGVLVHEEIVPGGFHIFDLIASNTAAAQRFFASQCRALRAALVDVVPQR